MREIFNKHKKENKENGNKNNNIAKTSSGARNSYPKPKILLIDLSKQCSDVLSQAGYNVTTDTFGPVYGIKRSSGFVPVEANIIKNIYETEIVFVSTDRPKNKLTYPKKQTEDDLKKIWQQCELGFIDSRPLSMHNNAGNLNSIHHKGAIFIVFVKQSYSINYCSGINDSLGFRKKVTLESFSNWRWLEHLKVLNLKDGSGDEITVNNKCGEIFEILRTALRETQYQTVFSFDSYYGNSCVSIAKNKYDEDVADILYGSRNENDKRITLILPEIPNFENYILDLLEKWCSFIRPEFFPHLESKRWLYLPQYEIPKVTELKQKIKDIEKQAKDDISNIETEIERQRNDNKDWYTLLQGTGDELVKAVIDALKQIGFTDVHNMDEEFPEEKREDIQIRDRKPLLIVDVKGVQGKPSDDESMQSEKHAIMRMREDNKTPNEIKALTIINSEKNLPPDKRDQLAYRKEIIGNATDKHVGLMTTWDICRILRNIQKHGWDKETIKDIFYRNGRIEPIPSSYQYIGKVEKTWIDAFRIIPVSDFAKGSKLAIETEIEFVEFIVNSIQMNDVAVEIAPKGERCGISYANANQIFREKMRIFLVKK